MKLKGLYRIITIIFLSFLSLPSALAQVDGNITIVNGSITGNVCGNTGDTNVNCIGSNVPGASDSRDVTNNQIIVDSGGIVNHPATGGVYGGYTKGGGNVIGNIADIRGYTDVAYGGYQESISGNGVVTRNAVIVRSGGIVGGDVYGGIGYSKDVSSNTVIIESVGTVGNDIYGGMTNGPGNVMGNMVDIRGNVSRNVYGGTIYMGSGDIRGNIISVSGSVGRRIVGGESTGSGAIIGNMVTIENSGTVGTDVHVGITSGSGNVIGNMADIRGNVSGDVYSGITYGSGDVRGNTISVSGSVGRTVASGYSTGSGVVSGNAVTIENGGTVNNNAFGGISTSSGEVTDNIVTVQNGGSIGGSVIGGQSRGIGKVTSNTVNVSGSIGGDVFGGYGTSTSSGNVTNNTVNLNQGAAVTGDVFGGVSTGTGSVSGNTVNLNQGASITGGVFGGVSTGTGSVSDNTLNVNQFRGSVAQINAFQHYNFNMPLGLYAGDTLITITDSTPTNLTGSDVAVSNQFSAGAFTSSGDQITLIDQANGTFTTNFSGIGYGGVSEVYNLNLHNNANALVLEANGITVNPQTKALSQGLMSEIITLNHATDLITGAGLEQAKASLKKRSEGPAFFATASYANTRTKTGSHIDSDGWAGLVGLAWDEGTSDNTGWLASGFIEGGHGNWNAYNNFTGHSSVYSSGDTDYIGIGVLGHYRFENRIRFEASARSGYVESDYKAKGYAGGLQPKFDLSGMYYSGHVGVGYDLDLHDKLNLDMVGKYLWTLRKGETVTTLGERIHFDDINSHRVRVGGRLTYETALDFHTYVGLYGEYEFDGKSKARNLTANVRHEPLKIRGATSIGEVGVSVTPEAIKNLNIDFALQGHAGRRDGFVGNVALNWKF